MATKTVPACPDSDTLGACAKLFFELNGHADLPPSCHTSLK